jgi:hypothetical protein
MELSEEGSFFQKFLKVHYVYDSCEKNHDWTYGRAEPSAVLTSFAFVVASYIGYHLIDRRIAGRASLSKSPELASKSCLNRLIIVAILSAIHHFYLTWQSQIMDEIGVIQAQVAYLQTIRKLSRAEWMGLWAMVVMGLAHPLFPGLVIFYLFYVTGEVLIRLWDEVPRIRTGTLLALGLNVFALIVGVLDHILCPSFDILKLHSVTHICLAGYCLVGALVCFDLKMEATRLKY